ncbi:MAG: hypothetical protein ABJA10_03215, partial [Aestuariivirga sp.]
MAGPTINPNKLFDLDIENAQPVDQSRNANRWKVLSHSIEILYYGNTWTPVWSNVTEPEVWRDEVQNKQLPLKNGQKLIDPNVYKFTGATVADLSQIEPTHIAKLSNHDLYIRKDSQGEVDEVLDCNSITPQKVPYPGCTLSGRTHYFTFEADFMRDKLANLDS